MTHTLLSKHSHACPRTHTQATFVCHSTSRCHTRWRRQAVGDWDGRLANQPHIDLMQQDVTHSADHPKSLPGSERAPTGLKALLQLCTSTSLSIPSCFIFPLSCLQKCSPKNSFDPTFCAQLDIRVISVSPFFLLTKWKASIDHWSKYLLNSIKISDRSDVEFRFYSRSTVNWTKTHCTNVKHVNILSVLASCC